MAPSFVQIAAVDWGYQSDRGLREASLGCHWLGEFLELAGGMDHFPQLDSKRVSQSAELRERGRNRWEQQGQVKGAGFKVADLREPELEGFERSSHQCSMVETDRLSRIRLKIVVLIFNAYLAW